MLSPLAAYKKWLVGRRRETDKKICLFFIFIDLY